MSSTNIMIPIIIVVVIVVFIVVSLILIIRNSNYIPTPIPPKKEFKLDTVSVSSFSQKDIKLDEKLVIISNDQDFIVSRPYNNPLFTFSFTSNTVNLSNTLVVEYVLLNAGNFISNINTNVSSKLFANDGLVVISGTNTLEKKSDDVYKITHTFDKTGEIITLPTFNVNVFFTKQNGTDQPNTTSNLSEVKMLDK